MLANNNTTYGAVNEEHLKITNGASNIQTSTDINDPQRAEGSPVVLRPEVVPAAVLAGTPAADVLHVEVEGRMDQGENVF